MIWIIFIGIFAQLILQYACDHAALSWLPEKWTVWWRYKLATNLVIRFMWNALCAVPIGAFLGISGLYGSIIFLIANIVYETWCILYLHKKWQTDYVRYTSGGGEIQAHKNKIRKRLLKDANKEKITLYETEICDLVEELYLQEQVDVQETIDVEAHKKQEFLEKVRVAR